MTRPYHDRHGAPPPPHELMDEIGAAAKAGDKQRQLAAEAAYARWLDEQGWEEPAPEPSGWMAAHEAKEDQ
jgi:hypothetical protein